MTLWVPTTTVDVSVRALADRHYSRQTPGSRRFVQAGWTLVLKITDGHHEQVLVGPHTTETMDTEVAIAGWVTSRYLPQYVRHAWPTAWINNFFHNESQHRASDLIREAVAITTRTWGEPPDAGMVTMIDPTKVRRTRVVGYTYIRAGFKHVGQTKSKPRKEVFQLTGDQIIRIGDDT